MFLCTEFKFLCDTLRNLLVYIYFIWSYRVYPNLQCNEMVKKLLVCLVCKSGTKNKIIFAIYILNTILIRNQVSWNISFSLISSLIAIYKEN
jgi:hypothetical protein